MGTTSNPEFKAWLSNTVFWATYLAHQDSRASLD